MFAYTPPPTTESPSANSNASLVAHSQPPSTRPSRLRGLNYLRNYTQTHLSHQNNQSTSPTAARFALSRSALHPGSNHEPTEALGSGPSTTPAVPGSWIPSDLEETNPSVEIRRERAEIETRDLAGAADAITMARNKTSGGGGASSYLPNMRRVMSSGAAAVPTASNLATTTITDPRNHGRPDRRTTSADGHSGSATSPNPHLTGIAPDQMPTIKLIPHHDARAAKPSLAFQATSRTLPHEDCVIRVGRYSERDGNQKVPINIPSSQPIGFKSKVVSRRHCELWCSNAQWYIKDVKSSSGTFLNHIRLSQPNQESKPFPVNDGDVVQLGIDFRGGEEPIFRCVKIRVEVNRGWQKKLNSFNVSTHRRIGALNKSEKKGVDSASAHSSECSICLMSIAPCQSLFVAPCSHVWHYKCIRPILNNHKTYPNFLCPNCRAVSDLDADVDDPIPVEWNDEDDPVADAMELEDDLKREEQPDRHGHVPVEDHAQPMDPNRPRDEPIPEALPSEFSLPFRTGSLPAPNEPLLARRSTSQSALASSPLASGLSPLVSPELPETPPNDQAVTRSLTPPETLQQGLGQEGPLTPTNDAGPFVLDGSAGRTAGR